MIKTYEQLLAVKNKIVYSQRVYSGWVTFSVVRADRHHITFKSTSVKGFDFAFIGEDAVERFEKYLQARAVFATLEDGKKYEQGIQEKRKQDFETTYGNDKDAFMKYVIQVAVDSQNHHEYGDSDLAEMIHEVGARYYPEMLDND